MNLIALKPEKHNRVFRGRNLSKRFGCDWESPLISALSETAALQETVFPRAFSEHFHAITISTLTIPELFSG